MPAFACARLGQQRFEKSQAERAHNIEALKIDWTFRDDAEIANERPAGSPMSKGGKADFQAAVKAGTYDE